ncbi:MAG: hypothetical protein JOZ29_09100 [Deltaproteobacteria bacterium]|nr:hypothetical protein [Deltaproteobacteria bacterium]
MDMHIAESYFADLLGPDWNREMLDPYRNWINQQPAPIAACCRRLIGDEIANSNLVNLPLLLGEPFGIVDQAVLTELVLGNAFMLTFFLASDQLFDVPKKADRVTILAAMRLQAEMLERYDRVAPTQAACIWSRLVEDHVCGVLDEEIHHARIRQGQAGLDLAAYKQVIMRKNRYGIAPVPLLAASTGKFAEGELLRRVFDQIAVEIEFDDDLKDWAEDLNEGRFTPVVQALVQAAGCLELAEVRTALVRSDSINSMLDEIDASLLEAARLLSEVDFPCGRLRGWILRHREANRRLRADIVQRLVCAALVAAGR